MTALVEPLPRAAWTGQRKEGPQGSTGDTPPRRGAVLGEGWGEPARKTLPSLCPLSHRVWAPGMSRSGGWVSGPSLVTWRGPGLA